MRNKNKKQRRGPSVNFNFLGFGEEEEEEEHEFEPIGAVKVKRVYKQSLNKRRKTEKIELFFTLM